MESLELSQLIEALPAMAWIALANGRVELLNGRWCEYTGLNRDQATGDGWQSVLHANDLALVRERWANFVEFGRPGEFEARLRRHDGQYRRFRFNASPVTNDAGLIVRWWTITTDVEDLKRAEDALKASERDQKLILDTTPALIWAASPDGTTEYVNQDFLDYVGLTWEQLKGPGWASELHPDDVPALTRVWNHLRATGTPGQTEARLRRRDGEYRWFLLRANPLRNDDGNIVGWYGVNTDIEDLKRAGEELQRRTALLDQGEAISETGSFLWRIETNEITWSNQLYRIYAFELGTPVTLELIASRVHPEDLALMEDLVNRTQAARDFEFDHRLLMTNGSIKYLHLEARATRGHDGRLEYIGAARDVTERRLSERALGKLRAQLTHVARVSSLGALAASIAHEVNQPLSGIITNASTCLRMLAAESPNLDGARATAQRTLRDGNRASEVIQHLRGLFARKETMSEPVDLNDAAREVLDLSASELRGGGVTVRTEFGDSLPIVRGDRVQLQQVILNLILNAADAMRTIEDRPRNLVVTTVREETDHLRLSVRDSGVGVDPQNLEKLFDAFFSTKTQGMGVGLSISRSIIESHQGRLWATANDGPGATFCFSIPIE